MRALVILVALMLLAAPVGAHEAAEGHDHEDAESGCFWPFCGGSGE